MHLIFTSYSIYLCQVFIQVSGVRAGQTLVQQLTLVPHTNEVLGLKPQLGSFFCDICMSSLYL